MKPHFSLKQILLFFFLLMIALRALVDPIDILSWDVFGYYLYLPAQFIYSDLGLTDPSWLERLGEMYQPSSTWYQLVDLPSGQRVIKYSMGLSILLAPFFFLAHFLAEPLGFPADGMSMPYQYLLCFGGLLYAMVGLVFFTKVLRHFFKPLLTFIVLVLIFFGSNYFHLTLFDGTLLSHNFLFTLYAIILYLSLRWYQEPKYGLAVALGLCIGLATLIRPTEIICGLIPLLWPEKDSSHYWKDKIQGIKNRWPQFLVMGVCAFLAFFPQMVYWKAITGSWLFYSYTNPGEGLDFWNPHWIEFLFSFRKGWLVYTPIMIFALIGFYFLYLKNKTVALLLAIIIVLDIYISSCWTTWWYAGGSFSSRTIVPKYVLLAIPLGFFIEWIQRQRLRWIAIALGLFFITLNLFQSWQFQQGILSRERMTLPYYLAIFGRTEVSKSDKKLLLVERSTSTYQSFNNPEDYQSRILFKEAFNPPKYPEGVFELNKDKRFSPGIDISFQELTSTDHAWVVGEVDIFIPENYEGKLPLLIATFQHKEKNYKYRSFSLSPKAIKKGAWNSLSFSYLSPEVRSKKDRLKLYIWHQGNERVLVDNFKIRAYEPH